MKVVIIIPTYNESQNIERLVAEIFKVQPSVFVMVTDDNSPDGTAKIVQNLMSKYPNLSLFSRKGKEGLGKAYIDSFKKVLEDKTVDRIIMMDADYSHDPKFLGLMIEASKTSDVVIGSRYIKGGATEGWEFWRVMLSFFGNRYCKFVTRMPIYDCTAGFNVINSNTLRKVDLSKFDLSGYAFIMELKYLLWKAGATFKEIPILFKNRTGGESKISSHIISEGILAPWKMILK